MGEKSLRERRIITYNVCAMLFCADGEKEKGFRERMAIKRARPALSFWRAKRVTGVTNRGPERLGLEQSRPGAFQVRDWRF